MTDTSTACPCGTGAAYEACCGAIIAGTPAPTPEALMRSRYSAYVKGELEHLKKSLCAAEQGEFDYDAARQMSENIDWNRLEIVATEAGGPDDETGIVEFAAYYKVDGAPQIHRERSSFRREDGNWVYVDGEIDPKREPVRSVKVGRNEPCPCGSGKKYKKCCGAAA
mgnify:CR=1 FL=1